MKTIITLVCLLAFITTSKAQTSDQNLYEQGARWNSTAWKTPYQDNISDEEKLAGLALIWSEAKYNFAFFDKVPQLDWDSLYISYIPKALATKSTQEYYNSLQSMMALLNDGHTGVYFSEELRELYTRPSIFTNLIEDKVIITEVIDPKLTKFGIVPGTEITHVNGEDVKTYVAREVRPYVSASTEAYRTFAQYNYLFLIGKKGNTVEITYLDPKGKQHTKAISFDWSPIDYYKGKALLEFKMMPNEVAYVALNGFHDEKIKAEFDSIYPQLSKAKSLVIDIRKNGGGDSGNGWYIMERLTNKNFPLVKWESRNYQATKRAWGVTQSWYGDQYDYKINNPDTTDYFHGKVVVLTSPYTFSAAEDFLAAFVQAKRGIIVGEPSGGSTGQPLFFRLPGGGSARVCTKRDYLYDGTEWVGKGFQPDVFVTPTVQDIKNGKDTVLNKAMEVLRRKPM